MAACRIISALQQSPLWSSPGSRWAESGAATWASGIDTLWYLRAHRHLGIGLLPQQGCVEHYQAISRLLPVSPNAGFDEYWYQQTNADTAKLISQGEYLSGWDHYLSVGYSERRSPSWWFDEDWYESKYPDVSQGIRSGSLSCGFEHFLLYGITQNLRPSLYFDTEWYSVKYLTTSKAVAVAAHLESRDPDSRCPAPFFDPAWYRKQYLSDEKPFTDPAGRRRSTLEHYLMFGRVNGNSPSAHFNEAAYRKIYPEVSEAIAMGEYESGWEHFVTEGVLTCTKAPDHFHTAGVDYSGPGFLAAYERSLLLNFRQLHRIRELTALLAKDSGSQI